jgi:Phasin protein
MREAHMAQREPSAERVQKSVSSLVPPELSSIGKKRIEDLANVQAELLEKLEESNKQWFERMQSEIHLASELVSKLASVRSIPDATTAYQQWASRRLQMMAEDGKHLFSDAQSLMETSARLLSTGWRTNGGGVST